MANPQQVRQITIKVDTQGNRDLRALANQLGGINQSLSSLSSVANLARNAFGGFIAGIGIRELISLSDSMQQLGDRIAVLAGSASAARQVLGDLTTVANRTKTSVDGLATVYARLAGSTKLTNLTSKQLLNLTETLQNSFRLSGATTQEAVSVAVQLSQAISTGQLRGQELRSLLEGNLVIADLLRRQYGQNIFEKAEKGMIDTNDVIKLLLNNQKSLAEDAAKLGQTFDQTVTVALNNFKLAIYDINREIGASSAFASALEFIQQKFGLIAVAIGAVSLTAIPALITSVKTLSIALYSSPLFGLALVATGIGLALTTLFDNFEDLRGSVERLTARILDMIATAIEPMVKVLGILFASPWTGSRKEMEDYFSSLASGARESAKALREAQEVRLLPSPTDGVREVNDFLKATEAIPKRTEKEKKLKEILGEINQAFRKGTISAEEYAQKLNNFEILKLDRNFRDGKINLEKYNLELNNLRLKNINKEFAEGSISLDTFNRKVSENRVEDLRTKLAAGTISVREFNIELAKVSESLGPEGVLRAGTSSYLESIGTTAQNISGAITNTFNNLEDSMTEFIQTGIFNFEKFTKAILDDLTRIIVRAAIIKPLAEGILGATTSSAGNGNSYGGYTALPNAHGNVFDGGLQKFTSGGIVNSPTLFGFGKNKTGLMGEAGPEAIIPLSRGSNGDLGVQASITPVNIVINNNASGTEVTQQETTGPGGEKILEVFIQNTVRNGVANGAFDKAFGSAYGVRRKGT